MKETNQIIELLNGKSGYDVLRIGNIVKKEMNPDNYKKIKDWYKESLEVAYNPKIIYEEEPTIFIEYIDGIEASYCVDKKLLSKLIENIDNFSKIKKDTFDVEILLNKIKTNKSEDTEWNFTIEECINYVNKIDFTKKASLSHSDYTLGNLIVKDNKIYTLDSLYDKKASSYLLDFAKLKMSIDGYEHIFREKPAIPKEAKTMLEHELVKRNIYREVLILEFMYAVRLYNYNSDKERVKNFVNRIRKEIHAEKI